MHPLTIVGRFRFYYSKLIFCFQHKMYESVQFGTVGKGGYKAVERFLWYESKRIPIRFIETEFMGAFII